MANAACDGVHYTERSGAPCRSGQQVRWIIHVFGLQDRYACDRHLTGVTRWMLAHGDDDQAFIREANQRSYPQTYCLYTRAAYGACVRFPGHGGKHRDANGYTFESEAVDV
jgi:hypothetical protein